MTAYLDVGDLLLLAGDAEMRDVGQVAAAVVRPQAALHGKDVYLDLHTKAAALLHSLARNHALWDGNERLAWLGCAVFLHLNGLRPQASQAEVVELVVAVADGSLDDTAEIAERLKGMTN